jgi:hypothetical protein
MNNTLPIDHLRVLGRREGKARRSLSEAHSNRNALFIGP